MAYNLHSIVIVVDEKWHCRQLFYNNKRTSRLEKARNDDLITSIWDVLKINDNGLDNGYASGNEAFKVNNLAELITCFW